MKDLLFLASYRLDTYIPRAIYYMDFWTPIKSLCYLLKPGWRTSQIKVNEFARELSIYLHTEVFFIPHARIGLYLILKYLNFPIGSSIIMTPINIPEMLKMIRINHLKPFFVGYKKNSFEIDFDNLIIPPNARAFLYTPLAGIHINMDALSAFCKKNNLILIQDLTQSFGGKILNRFLHDFANYNFASFCDLKTIHTHRGGIVLTKDSDFLNFLKVQYTSWFRAASLKYFLSFILEDLLASLFLRRTFFHYLGSIFASLSNKGDNFLESLSSGHGIKIGTFRFATSFMASGNDWLTDTLLEEQKYRFTDLQASIGLQRLADFENKERKRINNSNLFYNSLSKKASHMMPYINKEFSPLFWKAPLIVQDFKSFQGFMLSRKIDVARSNLPWLPDLHNPFNQMVSGKEMRDCVYIPLHYYLCEEEILAIAAAVNDYADTT